MNQSQLRTSTAWRDTLATLGLLLGLAATNGCAVWDWARPAANPDAATPAASVRAKATIGDRGESDVAHGSTEDDTSRLADADDDAPEVATRFRPRAPRRSENLLLDERSRQIERNLGL